jgi:hypothetical protein
MEDSILISTKKILGIAADYTAFDTDILTHISSVLSIAEQLGIAFDPDFALEDESTGWSELDLPQNQLNLLRTYVFLKVRMLFDPPSLSFVIDAMNKQISEYEVRLNNAREELIPVPVVPREVYYDQYPGDSVFRTPWSEGSEVGY